MRSSPSIAPAPPDDFDVYLVLDDFGARLGRAWRKTNEERTDRRTPINDLMDGQYSDPAASLPSIPLKAGHAMSQPSLPMRSLSALAWTAFVPPSPQNFVAQHATTRPLSQATAGSQPTLCCRIRDFANGEIGDG